jgi:Periplasmic sensor domain
MRRIICYFALLLPLAIAGCSSNKVAQNPQAPPSSDAKTIAKILAVSGAAPTAFQDTQSAQALLSALNEAPHLKFAVFLEPDGSLLAQHSTPDYSAKQPAIISAVKERIARGETDFQFPQEGLHITVVPMSAGNRIVGYVALASI